MGDRAAKTALFDEFARAAKALASGRRIELLDVLANGERTVEALAGEVGLSVANTSQHLQILRQAGLVSSRREGTSIHYRLAAPEVFELWRTLRTLAASRLAEVERLAAAYLGSRDELQPVTREELARRLQDGDNLVVLDVRPGRRVCRRPPARGGLHPGRRSCGGGWPSCPPTERSSPTAAVPTAPSRTRPSACCARRASRRGGWRMGSRNGRPPAWPSPAPDHGSNRGARHGCHSPGRRRRPGQQRLCGRAGRRAGPGGRSGPGPHPVPGAGPLAAAPDRLCGRDPPACRLPDRQPGAGRRRRRPDPRPPRQPARLRPSRPGGRPRGRPGRAHPAGAGHPWARPRARQLPAPGRRSAAGVVQWRGAAGGHRGPHRPGRPRADRAAGPGRLPVPAPAAPVVARRAGGVPDPRRRLVLRRPGR